MKKDWWRNNKAVKISAAILAFIFIPGAIPVLIGCIVFYIAFVFSGFVLCLRDRIKGKNK
jgi:uncharacterized membrane protein